MKLSPTSFSKMKIGSVALFAGICLQSFSAHAQFQEYADYFTTPRNYTVQFTDQAPKIDGKLDEAVWQQAAWTEWFTDIEGDKRPKPTYQTHAKMVWTSAGLYIGAEILDPHVWAYLKNHDDIVFQDNDFEIFIDPRNTTHQYYEIELNAINTVFDLFMNRPYRNNMGAMITYDVPGMQTATSVQGTLNDPRDTDKGWTVEMMIPFSAMTLGNNVHVPVEGEFWRLGFSRVEWDVDIKDGKYVRKTDAAGKRLPEHNWIWSPQGLINMHFPERWGYLAFSKTSVGQPVAPFVIPYSEKQREYLWLLYYKQKDYLKKNNKYATTLAELNMPAEPTIAGKANKITLEATSRQFFATISSGEGTISIDHDGYVQAPRSRGN